ncbi:MAG: 3-oxoacyl-ACP reductase FabG [Bacteroidales bacterium]|nr:3-oxoacyl-ACP reductase FabG [Bacteroidales bacterium]
MKYAIVTGGSRGIGKAIALKLSTLGYHILINYQSNDAEALKTKSEIEETGGEATLLKFDVSNKLEIENSLVGWLNQNPDAFIEILVNNAGIKDDVLMMWMTDIQWESVIDTNLNSFFYVTRTILNKMLMQKYGRIINIVSLSGLRGLPGQMNYSAAKSGVIGATKVLAQEVARRGITVNAIAPGFIRTDMTKDLNEKELKSVIPVQRFGTPEEVAELTAFIASDKASYITGQTISINGGIY